MSFLSLSLLGIGKLSCIISFTVFSSVFSFCKILIPMVGASNIHSGVKMCTGFGNMLCNTSLSTGTFKVTDRFSCILHTFAALSYISAECLNNHCSCNVSSSVMSSSLYFHLYLSVSLSLLSVSDDLLHIWILNCL